MILDIDKDQSGTIDYQEFLEMMRAKMGGRWQTVSYKSRNTPEEGDVINEVYVKSMYDVVADSENKKRQDINSQSVDRCFTNFLTYGEGVRDGLSARYKTVEEEGSRIVTLFAEDPKKVPSSQIYSILANSITLIDRADAANKRDVEKSKKAEKRAEKMEKKKELKGGDKSVFAKHDLFHSGGADDIVARVRAKNNKRKTQILKRSSNQPDGGLGEAIKRPIAPPKPPPSLANRGSRGASKEFVQKNFDSDSI